MAFAYSRAIGSGLRSRGAALLRGAERLAGALAGTAVATLAAAAIGDDTPLAIAVVLLLVVAASLLREATYVACRSRGAKPPPTDFRSEP